MLGINQLTCCAIQELEYISGLQSEYILEQFCERYRMASWTDFYTNTVHPAGWASDFPGFVIFNGVIKAKDGYNNVSKSQINLAKYIKKHKLGRITTLRANYNRENEPDHLVKVWLWSPAQRNLRKWYTDRMPKEEE